MRDSVSVGPPAGKTLMYRTGLFGQSSAARAMPAASGGAARALADRASARRRGRTTLVIFDVTSTISVLRRSLYRGAYCCASDESWRRNGVPQMRKAMTAIGRLRSGRRGQGFAGTLLKRGDGLR